MARELAEDERHEEHPDEGMIVSHRYAGPPVPTKSRNSE
jgi:hypothetical protein